MALFDLRALWTKFEACSRGKKWLNWVAYAQGGVGKLR